MNAKVAVVIPTCNRPKLLPRAVASVRKQTRKPDEVIVVNDGDAPWDLFAETSDIMAGGFEGVRIVETDKYRGHAYSRNFGVSKVSPEINAVCYLDDDDELLPEHVERLAAEIEKGSAFAFSQALFKLPGVETTDPEPNNKGPKRYYDPNALLEQNIAPISSFMHTTQAFSRVGGFDEGLPKLEDWDFWARMSIACGPPVFVPYVTNVIHKDDGIVRQSNSNFGYSMMCHWRDIVADRIKALSKDGRCRLSFQDRAVFHVPRVTVVLDTNRPIVNVFEMLDALAMQPYKDYEVVVVDCGFPKTPEMTKRFWSYPKVRLFPMVSSDDERTVNYGLLLSRSEMVTFPTSPNWDFSWKFLGHAVEELDGDRALLFSGNMGGGFLMRRRLLEMVGGLDADSYWGFEKKMVRRLSWPTSS